MKICSACKKEFNNIDWNCPECDWVPTMIGGFPAFSPELANENDGLPKNAHHVLDRLQENSFWFRVRNQLIQDAILRYYPDAKNVLEIGCGTGYVLNGIRGVLPEAHLTASEILSYGLSYAAKRVSPPTQFLQMDARMLPFKNEFDLIGAFDVLEHIEEDELVIQNFRKSLKIGGGVILTVPQHPFLWSKVDDISCHKRRYKRNQLAHLLIRNGFKIQLNTSFMFILLPLMWLQRLTFAKKHNYNSVGELTLPKWIDKIFEKIFIFEKNMIQYGLKLPIGGSRLVMAQIEN